MLGSVTVKNSDGDDVQMRDVSTWRDRMRRTPFYFIGLALLFVATLFVLIALFSNNWVRTASYQMHYVYHTYGLWFYCRRYNTGWTPNRNSFGYNIQSMQNPPSDYCQTIHYNSVPFTYVCQIFYTISAVINFFTLTLAFLGVCVDIARNRLFIPTVLVWTLLVSTGSQLIAVCVYGGVGIGWDTVNVPDYSMILASIALCLTFFSAVFNGIEISYFKKRLVS